MTRPTLKTLLCAAAIVFAAPVAVAEGDSADVSQAEATMLTVNVKGMVCDFCARAVTKVFSRNDAVENVHVDLDKGEIHVALKPGMALSDAEVETMVENSGYAMVSVDRETL